MNARAMSGTTKSRTANTETKFTWKITKAPDALFEGKMSMNERLEKEGFNISAHNRKMNDFHDSNTQTALNLKKADKKEFLNNLDADYILKLYPKSKKFLSKTESIFDEDVTIAKQLADDLYFKITSPREYFSEETILKFKKRRGDM